MLKCFALSFDTMVRFMILYQMYNYFSVLSEVSVFLPYGNHVGIGLSFPMEINVKPDMCIGCPLIIEVVPPYFTNSQINQPMLNLENCVVRYVSTNIAGQHSLQC